LAFEIVLQVIKANNIRYYNNIFIKEIKNKKPLKLSLAIKETI
jgi:hypothetical protein